MWRLVSRKPKQGYKVNGQVNQSQQDQQGNTRVEQSIWWGEENCRGIPEVSTRAMYIIHTFL